MYLLTYHTPQGLALGIKTDRGVLDVAAAAAALGSADVVTTPDALLRTGTAALAPLADLAARAGAGIFRAEEALRLGPCVVNPGKIICVGLNYRRHAAESGMKPPETPVLFSKFTNAIAAADEPVPLPHCAAEYDYEVELGVVIGRRAHRVGEADSLNYVLGYCTANDLSARDLQMRTSQWLLGKSLEKFLPVGPYLVTGDAVPDPQTLGLRCWVNGELRQNSNTADMIYPVARIISYISQYMPLEPGDLILTGTPEGVILGMPEKVWLKPGDQVMVEVAGLGAMTNALVSEG